MPTECVTTENLMIPLLFVSAPNLITFGVVEPEKDCETVFDARVCILVLDFQFGLSRLVDSRLVRDFRRVYHHHHSLVDTQITPLESALDESPWGPDVNLVSSFLRRSLLLHQTAASFHFLWKFIKTVVVWIDKENLNIKKTSKAESETKCGGVVRSTSERMEGGDWHTHWLDLEILVLVVRGPDSVV